jgi:hypothetical protein
MKKRPRIRITVESGALDQPVMQHRRDKVGDGVIRAEGYLLDGCPVIVDDVLPTGNMIVQVAVEWKGIFKKGQRVTIGPAEYMGY